MSGFRFPYIEFIAATDETVCFEREELAFVHARSRIAVGIPQAFRLALIDAGGLAGDEELLSFADSIHRLHDELSDTQVLEEIRAFSSVYLGPRCFIAVRAGPFA